MKNGVTYGSIGNDLLKLYCKIQDTSLEDIYIKYAQDYTRSVLKFIRTHSDLKNEINNPVVYEALETLDFLRSKIGDSPSLSDVIRVIQPHPKHLANIPMIIAFKDLLGGPANDILSLFHDIIMTISKIRPPEDQLEGNRELIQEDLLYIQKQLRDGSKSDYVQIPEKPVKVRKLTLKQKRLEIFTTLLKRFSYEMASVAEAAGMHNLSAAFNNGILATNPATGVGSYINIDTPSGAQGMAVNNMVNMVIKNPNPELINYYHDSMEINFLQVAGVIEEEDLQRFKSEYQNKMNQIKYIEDKSQGDTPVLEDLNFDINITNDDRMNPDYIKMLSLFFYFMKYKLNMSIEI